jgi:hypothetical protein
MPRAKSQRFACSPFRFSLVVQRISASCGRLVTKTPRSAPTFPTFDVVAKGAEAAEPSDLRFPWAVTEPDARAADQIDNRPAAEAAVVDADGAGGSMGGAGGVAGSGGGGGGTGSGGATSTGGSVLDGASFTVDSSYSETAPAEVDSGFPEVSLDQDTEDVAEVAVDLPTDSAGDSSVDVALDVPWDLPSPDLPAGTLICPATIAGSLDSTDSVQTGRLSRVAPVSACGISKPAPGKDADPTNSHLYDVYHFGNPTNAPACFNFRLKYPGAQLFAVAYASFDRTDITQNYLGDVGDVLNSPQGMGITVGPASTVDVVVSAIAVGTSPAGSYTLSCSAQ